MPYKIYFITLGCAKNRVNCEQMMALVSNAGHEIILEPEGADVAVINTCGFLTAACEEAIENILELAELKKAGLIKKILVTGCMVQRYREEILREMPEVDGILGTGAYDQIAGAIAEVMGFGENKRPCILGDINIANQSGERILSTPPWYAYLRIAEGCDNRCAYCVIPELRGRYRSREMDDLLQEASELSDAGVKELIVIAQDITRYGLDLYQKRRLPELLKKLCEFDFKWIRPHYLYPSDITDELIDIIASEKKILKYLDIPIQHCNNKILKLMRRRDNKENLIKIFKKLREKIPGLVLRTSIITGLPGEDQAEFEELCEFLREMKIERAGVFPFSPEDGTAAAEMPHVDEIEAKRRADLIVNLQSDIIDAYNQDLIGAEREVLCEGFDREAGFYYGRSYAESPEIDGVIWFRAGNQDDKIKPGAFVNIKITGVTDGELTGIVI